MSLSGGYMSLPGGYMSIPKDGRIVEDRALGIYPNSVYALYTCI